jgi:prepilin-type N-terminal cleavage/methylation domain-containing protein
MSHQPPVISHQPSAISHQPSKSGMSLLEVILAIAVAGFVLAAAVSLLVSISSIWSERAERHFFVDHVDGVTEFLNATFASAGVEIALADAGDSSSTDNDEGSGSEGDSGEPKPPTIKVSTDSENTNETNTSSTGGLIGSSDKPVAWARPPGFSDSKDPLLNFKLTKAPPLLVGLENAPLLGLDVFLYFDDTEGLSLLWYSILQEDAEDINDLRRTAISQLVTDIHYIYWDESFEKWEEEDEPMEGDGDDQYLLPRFIKLIFEYEGETQKRTLTIPVPSKSALIY